VTRARVLALVVLALSRGAAAQTEPAAPGPPQPLTLDAAIQYATEHYPTIRAAVEQVVASAADVDVARAVYLPRLDSVWQSNRATANNIFGQVLPQSVIPSMSGPVLASTSSRAVWGSAAGALLSWEPLDFGWRRASVAGAEAALARARAAETLTRLDVATEVAAAFLDLAAAQGAVAAAQADVDRRDVLRTSAHALVDSQLRAGAEASRADAERAAAHTRLIQARQAVAIGQATLARVLGVTSGPVTIAAEAVLGSPPAARLPGSAPSAHPMAQAQLAAVAQARAQEEGVAKSDVPRVYVQSSVFARGSGAGAGGVLDGGVDGLALDRANWAAGVQVVFPNVFDVPTLRARKAAAAASMRSEAARYDEAVLSVTSQQQTAAALLDAARAVAANTPLQLAAAQQTETQARARYAAGLASIVEVADAQGLLAQAELQDRLARINVWRGVLATAAAQGDLNALVALLRQQP